MNALFRHGPELNVITRDGANFRLVEEKEIITKDDSGLVTTYVMPVGAESDGTSIPEIFAPLGFTKYGPYWPAAYAHDCAYRNTLLEVIERMSGETRTLANLTKAQSDELMLALMFSTGTDETHRKLIYEALVIAGKKAFEEDRRNP